MKRSLSMVVSLVVLLIAGGAVAAVAVKNRIPMRVVQVDLDYVYDPNPAQQEKNLQDLVARINKLQINTVFLQAFANPEGTGLASALYFPNRHLPVRGDLFAHAVQQLKQQAHVKVYGWLPVLSFDFGDQATEVVAWNKADNKAERDPKAYRRLSPFDAKARQEIADIYEDMARQAPIDGVLFHDDALLSDFEDASAPALAAYKADGLPPSVDAIRNDPAAMQKWTDFKTDALIQFTQDLAAHARRYHSHLVTVRNIYAPVLLDPQSRQWFAQDYDRFLKAYDYTAVEAMPKMENVPDPQTQDWMQRLVVAASQRPEGLKHTIFELQSVDWHAENEGKDRAIPVGTLIAEMRFLAHNGALNFGYYPDDFVTDTPKAELLHKDFSLPTYAYLP